MKRILLQLLLCSLVGFLWQKSYAQGWQRKYSPDRMMAINSIYPTYDNGFMMTGFNLSDTISRIMRIDAGGSIKWKQDHDSVFSMSFSTIAPNKGYFITGSGSNIALNHSRTLLRTDSNGTKLWLTVIDTFSTPGGQSLLGNMELDTTDDGGAIVALHPFDRADSITKFKIVRVDASGNIVWSKVFYDDDSTKYVQRVLNSKDGGFLVQLSLQPAPRGKLFKIDGAGNLLWEYTGDIVHPRSIASDGNIWAHSYAFYNDTNYVGKLDQNGNELWVKPYPGIMDSTVLSGIIEITPDTLVAICHRYLNADNQTHPNRIAIVFAKLDTLGNILSQRQISTANLGTGLRLIIPGTKCFNKSTDGGFVFAGYIENSSQNATTHSGFVIKMDRDGQVYPSTIHGHAFKDTDINCLRDSAEIYLKGTLVTLFNATDTFNTLTGDSGYYSLGIDTGLYQITTVPMSPYWESTACNTTQINLQAGKDSLVYLGFEPLVNYPYITLNGNTRQRICASNTYYLQYCNTGTEPFVGVIDITVDTALQIDSASVNWVTQNDNKALFVEAGLAVGECREIKLYYTVPCDLDLTGRTTCINAHAYNDTVINASVQWDQSNLKMSVAYNEVTDSVEFTLKNVGKGNMNTPQSLIVIEDNVILTKEPWQLNSGATLVKKVKANGATWRATIPQTAFNPFSAFTTAAIEAAGTNTMGTFSTGFINQFPINGNYGFDHTVCAPILNSYDPNRKSVFPEGVGPDHLIDSSTVLEYLLEFQNTGTDTAYVVRLVDTLAPYLNAKTLRPGVSSHPYQFRFLENNVIEFLFEAINLPDSGANQAGSNGFVRFKINQVEGNTQGTVINNNVSIYFDYNLPVVTNTATVTIGKLVFSGIESVYQSKPLNITAYPNPFATQATIKVEGETFEQMHLVVYDMNGRMVHQQYVGNTDSFTVNRASFTNGNYLFEIRAKNKSIGKGKITAQ